MLFMELTCGCRVEMTVMSLLDGPRVAGGEHVRSAAFFLLASGAGACNYLSLFRPGECAVLPIPQQGKSLIAALKVTRSC